MAEGVHITLDRLERNVRCLRSLNQQVHVVHTLCPGHNLLPPNEEVVRIGEGRVGRIRHGVEGSHAQRVLVHYVEVSVILLLDKLTQLLLVDRTDILVEGRRIPGILR